MIVTLIEEGFGEKEDLNCAEKILGAANKAYDLGLDKESLKLASGFGGGMAIEGTCGALTASIMVLGKLFVQEKAHENTQIKDLTRELFSLYEQDMGDIDCAPLKEKYRTEEVKCNNVIIKAAEVLDEIVKRNAQ